MHNVQKILKFDIHLKLRVAISVDFMKFFSAYTNEKKIFSFETPFLHIWKADIFRKIFKKFWLSTCNFKKFQHSICSMSEKIAQKCDIYALEAICNRYILKITTAHQILSKLRVFNCTLKWSDFKKNLAYGRKKYFFLWSL